jgi:hypothetical protein
VEKGHGSADSHERLTLRLVLWGQPLYNASVAKGGSTQEALAVVTYPAPHGIEAETLSEGDVVDFGRGAECPIRFGYAPQPDQDVPRIAGQFIVMNNRVFIESSAKIGHRALEVRTANRSVQIAIGEGYSPRDPKFEVLVRGAAAPWKLGVTVRSEAVLRASSDATDPPTAHYTLNLTHLQLAVLETYCEPLRRGRIEPATHKEVASVLSYHPNTVREALYEIWTQMFEQGVPMPDISDKRMAVVEAARVHGILTPES